MYFVCGWHDWNKRCTLSEGKWNHNNSSTHDGGTVYVCIPVCSTAGDPPVSPVFGSLRRSDDTEGSLAAVQGRRFRGAGQNSARRRKKGAAKKQPTHRYHAKQYVRKCNVCVSIHPKSQGCSTFPSGVALHTIITKAFHDRCM